MLSNWEVEDIKYRIAENNEFEFEFNSLQKQLNKVPYLKSKLEDSNSVDEVFTKMKGQVFSSRLILNLIFSTITTLQLREMFSDINIVLLFLCILLLTALIYYFFIRPNDRNVLGEVENNRSSIERYYFIKNTIEENASIIDKTIEKVVSNLCKNKPIIDVEELKYSNLSFIPDEYLFRILDRKVEKGVLEMIEVASTQNKGAIKRLYKSKNLSQEIETDVIVID